MTELLSNDLFLAAFAQSRKAPISFVMSVCPCWRMYQHGSHWMYYREIWYWDCTENLSSYCKFC